MSDRNDAMTWVYWHIYPEDRAGLDQLILHVLDSELKAARLGASSWHYLRFIDQRGHHLRVRLYVTADVADDLVVRFDELQATVVQPEGYRPRIRGLDWRVYQPEVRKWGHGHALRDAHEIFAASSEWALERLRQHPTQTTRFVDALRLTTAVARALPTSDAQRLTFLERHSDWWAPAQAQGTDPHSESSGAATRRVLRSYARGNGEPACASTMMLASGLIESLHRPRSVDARSPLYYCHQHLHLTLNRLGVTPSEEAWMAGMARDVLRGDAEHPIEST